MRSRDGEDKREITSFSDRGISHVKLRRDREVKMESIKKRTRNQRERERTREKNEKESRDYPREDGEREGDGEFEKGTRG